MAYSLRKFCAGAAALAVMLSSTSASARPWWQTALMDANGALEGGAAGAALGTLFGPEGTIAGASIGAAIGGAAASLTVVDRGRGDGVTGQVMTGGGQAINIWDPTGNGGCTDILLPPPLSCGAGKPTNLTTASNVQRNPGQLHNLLVKRYVAQHRSFNRDIFLNFAIKELNLTAAVTRNPKLREELQRIIAAGEAVGLGQRSPIWEPPTGSDPKEWAIVKQMHDELSKAKSAEEFTASYQKLALQYAVCLNCTPFVRPLPMGPRLVDMYMSVLGHSAAYWQTSTAIASGNCFTNPRLCTSTGPTFPETPK
jgi:hypothetical protein